MTDTTAAFPVAGVDVEIQGVAQLSDALGEAGQTLAIKKGGTATREVDLLVGGDVADVTAQALAVQMQSVTPFSGTSRKPSTSVP